MKLNGIVNLKRFVERRKWISALNKDGIEHLLSRIRQTHSRWIWDQTAFIYDSSNTNYKKKYTYSEVKPK
jgi:hypothetical protein